jgi:hypothetical protein
MRGAQGTAIARRLDAFRRGGGVRTSASLNRERWSSAAFDQGALVRRSRVFPQGRVSRSADSDPTRCQSAEREGKTSYVPTPSSRHGRPSQRSLVIGAVAGLAVVGLYFYLPGLWRGSTDGAYAHAVSIVPKVAAYVSKLHVNDHSKVARDDLLPELDPRDSASRGVSTASSAARVRSSPCSPRRMQPAISSRSCGASGQNRLTTLGWVSPGMSVEAKIYMSEPPAWLSFLEW